MKIIICLIGMVLIAGCIGETTQDTGEKVCCKLKPIMMGPIGEYKFMGENECVAGPFDFEYEYEIVDDLFCNEEISLEEQAKLKCIEICNDNPIGTPLNVYYETEGGPCLSDDNPDWNIDDWVCDVAHEPREEVDNLPENQCREFREGNANHFVEVDVNCEVIYAG